MNTTKTFLLLAVMTALFGVIGLAIGGKAGMMIALLIAIGMNIFAYWNSDKMLLKMYDAEPIEAASQSYVYDMTRELAQNANMPMPKLYILHNHQPNAFATGRNPENAAVAVTTGIMDILSREELAGVIAHELAHIKNRDTLTMTVTASLAGAIGMIANMAMFSSLFGGSSNNSDENNEGEQSSGTNPIVMMAISFLAPMAAGIVQMAISRSREYEADKMGAEICKNPLWLASALAKIESAVHGHSIHNRQAEENPATAHLFIINPLLGKGMDNLFSTHPNTQNRIAALEELAGESLKYSEPKPSSEDKLISPWE